MTIQLAAFLANVTLAIALLIVGGRLLLLAGRTRQKPELILGISSFTAGGSLLVPLGLSAAALSPGWRSVLEPLPRLLSIISVASIALLAWKVFRADDLWARALCLFLTLGLLPSIFESAQLSSNSSAFGQVLWWTTQLAVVISYVWAAAEAFIYQRGLRRRQRYGLAPKDLVPNQILIWSFSLGLTATIYSWLSVVSVSRHYFGRNLSSTFVTSSLGLLVSICLWLAFFPPKGRRQGSLKALEE